MQQHELEDLLDKAAERGAARALARVGLADEKAGKDVAELRDWLSACRVVKAAALKTTVSVITKSILMVIVIGIAYIMGVRLHG